MVLICPHKFVKQLSLLVVFCQRKNQLNSLFKHLDKQSSHLVRSSLWALHLTMLSRLPILCIAGNWTLLHQNVIRSLLDLNLGNSKVHMTKNLIEWRAYFFPPVCFKNKFSMDKQEIHRYYWQLKIFVLEVSVVICDSSLIQYLGYQLENHVIRTFDVSNEDICQLAMLPGAKLCQL